MADCFKNRTLGFWLGLIAAGLALAASIFYVIAASGDRTFTMLGFVLLVVGAAAEMAVLFTDWKFAPLLPTLLIAVAAGFITVACLPTLMDLVNGINFFGGNLAVAFAVPILCVVSLVLGCIANFHDMRKVA